MKIEFIAKDYKISEKLKEVVSKKLDKMDKYFNTSASALVVCKNDNGNYKMEVSIKDGKTLFRAEVSSDNMYANIDLALPKVERQIYKNREKLKDKIKNTSFKDKDFLFFADEPNIEISKIEKTKKFLLEPCDKDEAVMNLESTDHDFYIFLNVETNKVAMVYRRHNGGIGLIELDY